MSENFSFAFRAVTPIILTIALGYLLRRIGFLTDGFLKTANKLMFNILLPCLLFVNVYIINSISDINWGIIWFCLIMIALIFIIGLVCCFLFIKDNRQKGVALQCAFRSNFAIIGTPLAQSLGGAGALSVAAVLSAFSIPFFNVLAVISLTVFSGGTDNKVSVKSILRKIIANPLIIAVACGMAVLAVRALIPLSADGQPVFSLAKDLEPAYSVVSSLAKCASPVALLVLGGQFDFRAIGSLWKQITLGTLLRIVIAPALALSLAVILSNNGVISLGPSETASFIALFGSPVAVSSAIMASQMGGDEQLAGQYVVWTCIGSIFTIFASIVIMRSMCLL